MSRVKMPHNNRVSGSAALKTNDIWSKTIGYDPYAAPDDQKQAKAEADQSANLLLLARLTNLSGSESRGGCKRCGMLGHLTFQCRNPIATVTAPRHSESESDSSSDESENDRKVTQKDEATNHFVEEVSRKRKHEYSSSDSDSNSSASREKKSKKKRKQEKKSRKHKKHKKDKKEKKSH